MEYLRRQTQRDDALDAVRLSSGSHRVLDEGPPVAHAEIDRNPLEISSSEAEAQPEIHGYSRHQQAVLIGSLMVTADGFEPTRQPVLGDTVGDAIGCTLRAPDVDGLAAQYRREHRTKGDRTRGGRLAGAMQGVVRTTSGEHRRPQAAPAKSPD